MEALIFTWVPVSKSVLIGAQIKLKQNLLAIE